MNIISEMFKVIMKLNVWNNFDHHAFEDIRKAVVSGFCFGLHVANLERETVRGDVHVAYFSH